MRLDAEVVGELHAAALGAGLVVSRDALLRGLPAEYTASILRAQSDGDQIFLDLHHLNDHALPGGPNPLLVWLTNAAHLAETRGKQQEARCFRSTRARLEPSEARDAVPCDPVLRFTPNEAELRISAPPAPVIAHEHSPIPFSISVPVTDSKEDRLLAWRDYLSEFPPLPAPPRFQNNFVGRHEELARLKQALVPPPDATVTQQRVAALCGIGGMGKTATAQEFAERYGGNFRGGILWGDFGSDDSSRAVLETEVARWEELLHRGNLPRRDRGLKIRLDALKVEIAARVTRRGHCLAVLDNVDTRETLDALLDMLSPCAVLITTRKPFLVQLDRITVVELNGLSAEEGMEYAQKVLNVHPGARAFDALRDAFRHVDHHPLAMRMIGSLVKNSGMLDPIKLVQWITRPPEDLGKRPARQSKNRSDEQLGMRVPQEIEDCFEGTIDSLDPATRVFLIAAASLPPGAWSADAADYVSGTRDMARTRRHIHKLCEAGLLHPMENERFGLHRALRAYLRGSRRMQGVFGLIPRTWEIPSLPALLRRIAPGVPAGKVVYDVRQEHWAMRFVRLHAEELAALRGEWGAIVLGLRRRAELGFGAAARQRLDKLKQVLRWTDLSELRLEAVVLDGTDLSGVRLARATLSGEPVRTFPSGAFTWRMIAYGFRNTLVSCAALALALLLYKEPAEWWDPANKRLLLFSPVAFIGTTGPVGAFVLRLGVLQRWLDDRNMRSRYMVERSVEVLCFLVGGFTSMIVLEHVFEADRLWEHFAKLVLSFAAPFLFTIWLMFKLASWAGRFHFGGFFVRVLFASSLAFFVLASSLLGGIFAPMGIHPVAHLWPMAGFAWIAGLLVNPERPLLSSLRTSYLREAILRGANLVQAKLDHVQLRGANLENADLTGASLVGADLTGADLTGTLLSGAKLSNARMEGVNLAQADLSAADLRGVDLSSARVDGETIWSGAHHDETTRWPPNIVLVEGAPVYKKGQSVPPSRGA